MAGSGVLEGLDLEAVGLEPRAGPEVILVRARGEDSALRAPLPQEVGEEMVIAVPAPLGIEGDEEEVGPVEVLERLLSRGRGVDQHGIAQGAAEPIEDGGAQQEGLDGL